MIHQSEPVSDSAYCLITSVTCFVNLAIVGLKDCYTPATKPRRQQKQDGAIYSSAVNQLGFGSAIARNATPSSLKVASLACTVRSPALFFLSHAKFCRTCRHLLSEFSLQFCWHTCWRSEWWCWVVAAWSHWVQSWRCSRRGISNSYTTSSALFTDLTLRRQPRLSQAGTLLIQSEVLIPRSDWFDQTRTISESRAVRQLYTDYTYCDIYLIYLYTFWF